MRNKSVVWGGFLALLASISWGAMFPVANHSFQYIDSFYFTIFRYIPVAIILVVLLWKFEGKKAFKPEGKGFLLWFLGTMAFTIYNLFIFWGQEIFGETGVLLASIMEALMPLISVLIIWLISKKRPSAYTLTFIGLAFIGVLLVVTNGEISFLLNIHKEIFPLILLLLGVIGWVIYTMGGERFADWSILRYSTLTLVYGTLTATVIVFLTTAFGFINAPTLTEIYAVRYDMLFMVIFPGLIALLGWNEAVRILKPINSLLFISFVPVTTLTIGFFQGYAITLFDVIGTTLIVLALLFNNIYQRTLLYKEENKPRKETTKYKRSVAA